MAAHVLLSSKRQDWRTPEWFLDLVRRVGPIGLDPATSPANPTFAEQFFAPAPPILPVFGRWLGDDGLRCVWPVDRLTFVNPPYGPHLSGPVEPDYQIIREGELIGVGRGWAEKIASHEGERIALVPVRTETAWWGRMFYASDLVLFWGSPVYGSRISFVNPDTGRPQQGSNLASTVFYRGPQPERFADVFAPHGILTLGGRYGCEKQEAQARAIPT